MQAQPAGRSGILFSRYPFSCQLETSIQAGNPRSERCVVVSVARHAVEHHSIGDAGDCLDSGLHIVFGEIDRIKSFVGVAVVASNASNNGKFVMVDGCYSTESSGSRESGDQVSLVGAAGRDGGVETALVEGSEEETAIWAKRAIFEIDVAGEVG